MLHYLRIAISALSLTACVLLVVLWVRSYKYIDFFVWRCGDSRELVCMSSKSGITVDLQRVGLPWSHARSWFVESRTIQENERMKLDFSYPPSILWFRVADSYVKMPHWFLVLVSLSLITTPWFPWSRRFSLRTLLIATTLVAVGLGVVVAQL